MAQAEVLLHALEADGVVALGFDQIQDGLHFGFDLRPLPAERGGRLRLRFGSGLRLRPLGCFRSGSLRCFSFEPGSRLGSPERFSFSPLAVPGNLKRLTFPNQKRFSFNGLLLLECLAAPGLNGGDLCFSFSIGKALRAGDFREGRFSFGF